MKNKYSIITVCKNSEKTIRQTIESVINQTYDNWEHIIVDGASTDSTVEIIEEYALKYQSKIKYISEPDYGIYDAMNKGIRMAAGDFVAILNSDDYYELDTLQKIESAVSSKRKTVYYAMERMIQDDIEESCSILNHHFLNNHMIWHEACFLSKDIYDELGLYSTEYKSASDYDYFIKLYLNKSINFVPVYEVTTNFRTGGASFSYIAAVEENKIKLKYGFVKKKDYLTRQLFNWLKHLIGTL